MGIRPAHERGERDIDGWRLVFEDDFVSNALDPTRWCPFHLPHWSTVEHAAASYTIGDGVLRLLVAPEQPPWCPEYDGGNRVSNLQTGHWSGPIGSHAGQHRFRDDLLVRASVPASRLFVPLHCKLIMRARAKLGPSSLAALWLIGFEDRPECSGEITVMEVFGSGVSGQGVSVGRGIKPINDPSLHQEFSDDPLPIRIEDWHLYALDWSAGGVTISLDGENVFHSRQSPVYPMQLMLNLYELDGEATRHSVFDAWFEIDYVRAYAADDA